MKKTWYIKNEEKVTFEICTQKFLMKHSAFAYHCSVVHKVLRKERREEEEGDI